MAPATPCVVCPHHDPQHQQQIFWGYLRALVCILLGVRATKLEQHFLPFRQLCKSALEATEPRPHLTSSTSLPLTAQLSLLPEKCPPCPTPPRPTCKDLPVVLGCHFCQRFCNTSGGGSSDPEVSALLPSGQLQAAANRQTITLALRPGRQGLYGKKSRSQVFPPHEDSLKVFYFPVNTGDLDEVTRGHDLNHTTVMRCFWRGVSSTTDVSPLSKEGESKVLGALAEPLCSPFPFPRTSPLGLCKVLPRNSW